MTTINTTDLRRTALRLRYHDIDMSDEVNCAAAEIDALRTRVDVMHAGSLRSHGCGRQRAHPGQRGWTHRLPGLSHQVI